MNILFIISSLKHGGAEKQTILDANYFSSENNVTLITFNDGELRTLLCYKVELIVLEKKGYIKTSGLVSKIIREKKISIINASLFSSMIISVLSAEKTGTPVNWFFHSHEFDLKMKSRIAYKYFSKKESLKNIFFVSDELNEYYRNSGINFPLKKSSVLYNAYSVNPDNKMYKIKPDNTIKIGYIGRLTGLKRVDYLLEAVEYLYKNKIMNIMLEIIGEGDEKNCLECLAKKLNIDKMVSFKGFQNDVEKYYKEFDIFALPSKEECLSMALIDAGVMSLPSVAFDVGGNKEIVVNDETGYIVKSKEEFMEKIQELVNDNKKRIDFGLNAKKFCIEKFGNEKRYKKLKSIFEKLV